MRRRGAVGFESTTYVLQRLSLTLNVKTVNMMQVECFILSFLRSYRISPTYQGTEIPTEETLNSTSESRLRQSRGPEVRVRSEVLRNLDLRPYRIRLCPRSLPGPVTTGLGLHTIPR
jgi:hypothetical protein